MPDQPRHWPETVERIFDKLLKFLSPFAVAYLGWLGYSNSRQIQAVESRQVENRQQDGQAKLINLLGTWKWLEQVADDTGAKKDRDAADRAKRIYERFKDEMDEANGSQ